MKPSNILTRVNVRLYSNDLDYLRRKFPDNYNAQLRRIVARWVSRHKEPEQQRLRQRLRQQRLRQ
jgi:hypothetical protein